MPKHPRRQLRPQINDVLPCFSFYNEIGSLNIKDVQFRKNFQWKMIHPYDTSHRLPYNTVSSIKKIFFIGLIITWK